MGTAVKVGIIGCGNISATYMRMGQFFKDYKSCRLRRLESRSRQGTGW